MTILFGRIVIFCLSLWTLLLTLPVRAGDTDIAREVGRRSCAGLAARVDAVAGSAPVLLRSFEDVRARDPDEPALRTAAFSYDNALAVIALVACERRAQALRVGEGLRLATLAGPRLRNAYRAGAVADAPLPNGWWDAKQGRWLEDSSQQGSATGNVAWVALAMLSLHGATHETRWLDAARRLGEWCLDNTADARGAGGFDGGMAGFDASPRKLTWKSTEHNIDLVALFGGLADVAVDAPARVAWREAQASARQFVESQWDADTGHFFVGTLANGITPNRETSALDVQLWAQLLPTASPQWRRAIAYIQREHAVPGGFDFNADRDGLWLEGTAQAALVFRIVGNDVRAGQLLATIDGQFAKGGLLYATREASITTGLALGAASDSADFRYFRRPHVGATAWAALAALHTNPFVTSGAARSRTQ